MQNTLLETTSSKIPIDEVDQHIVVLVEAPENVSLPIYATECAAGADLRACISQAVTIVPGASMLVPTGLKIALPPGYEAQVRPRSGLALKNQITVLNSPGTIDADYRGEIGVILINHGREPFLVTPEMRIAQLIIAPVVQVVFQRVTQLDVTNRGEGGFGHTGTR